MVRSLSTRGAVVVVSFAVLSACSSDQTPTAVTDPTNIMDVPSFAQEPAAARGGPPEFVPGEVIVKFRAGASVSAREAALQAASARVGERIVTNAMRNAGDREGITVLHTGLAVPAAIERLRGSPDVEYAEPNWIYRHTAVSNDTYYTDGSLWGMYSDDLPSLIGPTNTTNQYGSQAEKAWNAGHTGSAAVYVGVIDEGIQFTHPDLDANVWVNPFDPADGVDNDGNGYADDIRGWDFDGNDNTIYDGGTRGSLDDHGTHVAGTIGAERNGAGVVGVNWNVTLISGKFLGRRGGTLANAVKAVDYFTDLKTRHGLNIVATNNSWGGGGFSQSLLDAINRGGDAGILFIAAAGNGGSDGVGDDNDATASYPSNYECTANGRTYDCVIAVAAIKPDGTKSSFSNYGAKTVDIGAPGSGVLSTTAFNTYSSYSGTSMATPHVTGGAALYAASNPGSTAAQIRGAILGSATPTTSLSGKTVTGGRLNVSGF